MPRYIDADELWLQIDKQESFEQGRNRAYYKGLRDAKKVLDEQPTADVVERKKGKWIKRTSLFQCSACERFFTLKYNYCPNCGCEMTEGADNDPN